MSPDERAFLASIAAHPDADLPRLVFADWLDENGQPDRAEYIRRAIAFDPHRDRLDDEALNKERAALQAMESADRAKWDFPFSPVQSAKYHQEWLRQYVGVSGIEFRRGLVASIELTASGWIGYGHHLRAFFPTLRKVVIFRLNGLGAQLAACASLDRIRELELACWYSDGDAQAMADSPNIADVERLVLWGSYDHRQGLIFARSPHLPKLTDLHLVSDVTSSPGEWIGPANAAVGRPVASVYDFSKERYDFAPSFNGDPSGVSFLIGRMPDGMQVFAVDQELTTIHGMRFEADGRVREPFQFVLPPELHQHGWEDYGSDEWNVRLVTRREYFRRETGFTPAFIRVNAFYIRDADCGPNRENGLSEYWDHIDPVGEHYLAPGGYGAAAYKYVRARSYEYHHGDCIWWCGGDGHVHAT